MYCTNKKIFKFQWNSNVVPTSGKWRVSYSPKVGINTGISKYGGTGTTQSTSWSKAGGRASND